MKSHLKSMGSSLLITLSFVLGIGILSSAAMMAFKNSAEHVAFISGMAQAIYLLLVLLLLRIKKIDLKNTYGFTAVPVKKYLLPVAAAFCFSAFSNILQATAPIPPELIGGMSDDMEKSMIAFILSVFIIAPLVEEFVFRALIMTALRKGISTTVSIFISALLFALIHSMAGGILIVVHAFLGGLIFALSYVKTKSLFPAIIAHIFGNIGGYVPAVTGSLPAAAQYGLAAGLGLISVICCAELLRKHTASGGSADFVGTNNS